MVAVAPRAIPKKLRLRGAPSAVISVHPANQFWPGLGTGRRALPAMRNPSITPRATYCAAAVPQADPATPSPKPAMSKTLKAILPSETRSRASAHEADLAFDA